MTLWSGGWSGTWVGHWQGEAASDGFADMGLRAFGASTVTLGLVADGGGATFADMSARFFGAGSLTASLSDRDLVRVVGGNRPAFFDRDAGQPERPDLQAFARDQSADPPRVEVESASRYAMNTERDPTKDGQRSTPSQNRPRDAQATRRKA